jgi:DNA-binding NarL/FixJ family response regulator
MIDLLIVEDNANLRQALVNGLNCTEAVRVSDHCDSGEAALTLCLENPPQAVLMDVQLNGDLNGIQTAIAIRREFPRMPVVFYSIQDDDRFYRDFRLSGILSHYAYVRKSNYLMPESIIPLIKDSINGRSFIDPEIEARVQEVRHKDEQSPLSLLEPNEHTVIRLIAAGMTNEQIAVRLGFRDKRTISRTNGQIYAAWGLDVSAAGEKVARTRAAIIYFAGRILMWDDDGNPLMQNERGSWIPWQVSG